MRRVVVCRQYGVRLQELKQKGLEELNSVLGELGIDANELEGQEKEPTEAALKRKKKKEQRAKAGGGDGEADAVKPDAAGQEEQPPAEEPVEPQVRPGARLQPCGPGAFVRANSGHACGAV